MYKMILSASTFTNLANEYTHIVKSISTVAQRKYRSNFGTIPIVTAIIWNQINHCFPKAAEPKHLLQSLYFVETYCMESVIGVVWKCDEKFSEKGNGYSYIFF